MSAVAAATVALAALFVPFSVAHSHVDTVEMTLISLCTASES